MFVEQENYFFLNHRWNNNFAHYKYFVETHIISYEFKTYFPCCKDDLAYSILQQKFIWIYRIYIFNIHNRYSWSKTVNDKWHTTSNNNFQKIHTTEWPKGKSLRLHVGIISDFKIFSPGNAHLSLHWIIYQIEYVLFFLCGKLIPFNSLYYITVLCIIICMNRAEKGDREKFPAITYLNILSILHSNDNQTCHHKLKWL